MTIFETWEEFTISFSYDTSIVAFAIGPPCDLPDSGYTGYTSSYAPYFLVDSIILNEAKYFNTHLTVDSVGTYNSNLTLNAHTDTVGIFQWYLNGVALAGETDSIIDITGNTYPTGNYQVVLNYGIDCIIGEILVDYPLFINKESEINNISIYPNPATNNLQIVFNNGESITANNKPLNKNDVFIYDVFGRKQTITLAKGLRVINSIIIDVSNLQKGIYFVQIGKSVNKFVKD
jgi:hypothetical protein